jgi:putative endonuclease
MVAKQTTGFFTYIIRCADNSLYTGWTVDIPERMAAHNEGRGAKYTRGRGPVQLMASWELSSKSEAMKLERALKQLSRKEKQSLINDLSVHLGHGVCVRIQAGQVI